jgi:16S rRNA G966 N2-methylase RsmD
MTATQDTVTIDPEFKSLIPPLAPDELAQLEANILRDGCRDPLVVWVAPDEFTDPDYVHAATEGGKVYCKYCKKDVSVSIGDGIIVCDECDYGLSPNRNNQILIDGHNRHAICTKHDIEFETVKMVFADRTAAMLWMIDNQKGRRNVSDYDKGLLAMAKQELLRPLAKDSTKEGNSRGGKGGKSSAILPTTYKIDTRKEAAKEAGIGERTLDAVKLIKEAADKGEIPQETIDDLRHRKVAIHRVAKDIKETRQKAAREGKRMEAVKEIEIPANLIIGDFREHADKVPNGSLSLIFTDPPYDRKASEMLPALGEFAASKLMDGGSLVLYVGQTQIPAALDALRPHLRYWWTIACVHAGRSTVMREYGLNAGWKAVLWFVKGTRHDNSVMVNDTMSGGEEKTHHDWQQSESEAAYWVDKLTDPKGVVCDPFTGGGTTGAACKALGRDFIGFEIDETTAKIAAERI